jgi:hypothetical protein
MIENALRFCSMWWDGATEMKMLREITTSSASKSMYRVNTNIIYYAIWRLIHTNKPQWLDLLSWKMSLTDLMTYTNMCEILIYMYFTHTVCPGSVRTVLIKYTRHELFSKFYCFIQNSLPLNQYIAGID